MIIGTTINATGTEPASYYSPWFPRGGNRGLMTCNVIADGGSITKFEIAVETKNSEQSDKDATQFTWPSTVSTGTVNLYTSWSAGANMGDTTAAGLLELVRFRYTLTPSATTWVHFRMLQPQWFTN